MMLFFCFSVLEFLLSHLAHWSRSSVSALLGDRLSLFEPTPCVSLARIINCTTLSTHQPCCIVPPKHTNHLSIPPGNPSGINVVPNPSQSENRGMGKPYECSRPPATKRRENDHAVPACHTRKALFSAAVWCFMEQLPTTCRCLHTEGELRAAS